MAVTSSIQDLECQVVETQISNKKKNRSKDPGIRVIHGRIYDSNNGKTCHQCRQKTRDFTAECKNLKGNKMCTIKYCHKCLLNRYGEKAEDVMLLDDWKCPKCMGICNCSFCRKKQGHKPTGILVRMAKENGFSSVSELLQNKGPENFGHERTAKDVGASPNKLGSTKESTIPSPRKPGKENSFDGNNDSNSKNLSPISKKMKHKKTKREELQGGTKCDDSRLGESGRKKPKIAEEISRDEAKRIVKEECAFAIEIKSNIQSENTMTREAKKNENVEGAVLVEKKAKKQSQDLSKKVKNTEAGCEAVEGQMPKGVVFCLPSNEVKSSVSKSKPKTQYENIPLDVKKNQNVEGTMNRKSKKHSLDIVKEVVEKKTEMQRPGDIAVCLTTDETRGCNLNKNILEFHRCQTVEDIPLPSGTPLTTVAGIDLTHEDAGHALQFFEFCAAFGEVLDFKKGQAVAEAVIREMVNGRRSRRTQGSLLVQFHTKLLSLIQEDIGEESPASRYGKNSWLNALGTCVSNSKFMSKEFPSDSFDWVNETYDMLKTSQKLILLNFLCDEALNTNNLRGWIDDQNSKLVEKEKEAKEKVLAAKDKEKSLKQKMQDEVAKAIMGNNGAAFSISEHDVIVSQIRKEAAQAHAEMLAASGMVPNKRQRSDAVRTDPVLVDANGHAFWRLKGYKGEPDILLQDLENLNSAAPEDKWFVYDAEQKQGVDKYMSSIRTKRLRAQKAAGPLFGGTETNLV